MPYTIIGGRLSGPVDLSIEGRLPVPLEAVQNNMASAKARDLPGIPKLSRVGKALAVVGGGPSVRDHVEELKSFDGDIWAINGAWGWCSENGIDATFIAIDPHPIVLNWIKDGNGRKPLKAILSTACVPEVFDELKGAEIICLDQVGEGLKGGSSTAGLTPHVGAMMGYDSLTFYGCESSYTMGASHAYMHEPREEEMIISSNGVDYLTAPDFMMQARELSTFIAAFPEFLSEKSGGLLGAMMADAKTGKAPHIKWISEGMAQGLKNYRPAAPGEATQPFHIAAE